MKNIYLSIIKVVDKVGVMDLEQRRDMGKLQYYDAR